MAVSAAGRRAGAGFGVAPEAAGADAARPGTPFGTAVATGPAGFGTWPGAPGCGGGNCCATGAGCAGGNCCAAGPGCAGGNCCAAGMTDCRAGGSGAGLVDGAGAGVGGHGSGPGAPGADVLGWAAPCTPAPGTGRGVSPGRSPRGSSPGAGWPYGYAGRGAWGSGGMLVTARLSRRLRRQARSSVGIGRAEPALEHSRHATTRRISSIEVSPSTTFAQPSSRRVSIPCSRAVRPMSAAEECATACRSISSVTRMTSWMAIRPL